MAAIASARTALGFVPALSTSNLSPASCRSSPSAIWLRAELAVQRMRTRFLLLIDVPSARKNERRPPPPHFHAATAPINETEPSAAAAPVSSTATGTATTCRLRGANERAHNSALNLRSNRVHIDPLPTQESARVFDVVHAGSFNPYVLKSGLGELRNVVVVLQS